MNPATLLEALIEELRKAGRYNRNDQVAPAAILWPDAARRFEPLLPHLRGALPVLTLGAYKPQELTGPAIWIRCAIAGTLPDLALPEGVPVVYLPGVEKTQLRAVQECSDDLKPLAELQYRGVFFAHENGKDHTPAALLSQQGLKVAKDQASQGALLRALGRVALEPLAELQRHPVLNAEIIHGLLNPDPVGRLLDWMARPEDAQAQMQAEGTWLAFVEQCRQHYNFNPEKDGLLSAALMLGERQGKWSSVWERFAQAPQPYAAIAGPLRQAKPSGLLAAYPESWPQDNQEAEAQLRQELLRLGTGSAGQARKSLLALEAQHGKRRGWVWARLGQAPLAMALEPLAHLAEATAKPLGHGLPTELAQRYFAQHWQTDAQALGALARVQTAADTAAVEAALTAIYRPWLEDAAKAFQAAVYAQPLPHPEIDPPGPGTCLLFSDGLRLDVAHKLAEVLEGEGCEVERDWVFGALPGVTATAKPAISPLGSQLLPDQGFEVRLGGVRVSAALLRRSLEEAGFSVMVDTQPGDPGKGGWCEFGELDSSGHTQGLKLARHAESLVRDLAERVRALLEAGWNQICLITDHGWLLVPGGLPRAELPLHLTEVRKGRTARLKPGASLKVQKVPWRFDPLVEMAVAEGICAFEEGKVYEHGGLSVQECVLPLFTVRRRGQPSGLAKLGRVRWKGLRCEVVVEGGSGREQVALRLAAADVDTTVAGPRPAGQSLLVADDALEGQTAFVVVLSPEGRVVSQLKTRIGGE
jgi:hypothetical protein